MKKTELDLDKHNEPELPHIDLISDNEQGYSICFIPSEDASKEPKLQIELSLDSATGQIVHAMLQKIALLAQNKWSGSYRR